MKVLAVDLGGTHATCGLMQDREILARISVHFSDTSALAPLLPQLKEALSSLLVQAKTPVADIAGIGFGFCGLVDAQSNRITSTNDKYPDATKLDLSAWAHQQFGLPLQLENDARMALLGECHAGAAQGEADVVMFTLGTGIGGVAMMNGEPLVGKHGQAGVLGGHIPVKFDGRPCNCGGIGCAEAEASGWALPILCSEWPGFSESSLAGLEINFKNLVACAASGDPVARAIQEHCFQVWGATAIAAIHAFDPDLLVYGGGIMQSGDMILTYIQSYVARYAWTPWGTVRVRAAELGNEAALFGAVPLIMRKQLQMR